MAVRDRELVALLHRLEDIACREANLDKSELFDVMERVECAEERISVSNLLAGILQDARARERDARDGSAEAMAAVRALVARSIAPLVEAPFDAAAVARSLVELADELHKFPGNSEAMRDRVLDLLVLHSVHTVQRRRQCLE